MDAPLQLRTLGPNGASSPQGAVEARGISDGAYVEVAHEDACGASPHRDSVEMVDSKERNSTQITRGIEPVGPSGSQNDSTTSVVADARECWICREASDTPENRLTSGLCRCRGSIGLVHTGCLNYWVFSQRRVRCPSCNATYNVISVSSEDFPKGFLHEAVLLVRHLYLPLFCKCASILLGLVINGFAIAFAVGCAFYHGEVFADAGDQAPKSFGNVGAAADLGGSTATTRANAPNGGVGGSSGVWLWVGVMLFGWCSTALWRSLWVSWGQWRAEFINDAVDDAPKPPPYTLVECLHYYFDIVVSMTGCTRQMLWLRSMELCALTAIAYIISFTYGRVLVFTLIFLGAVLMRLLFQRKKINDNMRRFDEAQERRHNATYSDLVKWFITYITEMALFSFALTIIGGLVIHYALSPHILTFPTSIPALNESITFLRLLLYWASGTLSSILLMCIETTVIVNIFAPGVDLFFVRSVDLNVDSDSAYWSFILAQIFDSDPLQVLFDFPRLALIEVVTLFAFLALPLQAMFFLNDLLATKVFGSAGIKLAWVLHNSGEYLMGNSPANGVIPPFDGSFESGWGSLQELLTEPLEVPSLVVSGLLANTLPFVKSLIHFLSSTSSINILLGAGTGVIVSCLKVFPIKRTQLRVMRAIAVWLAAHVVYMEDFLFDKERLQTLDNWLQAGGEGDVPTQRVPLAFVFLRRERVLPPEQKRPAWLKVRLIIFSAMFFIASTGVFWALPVLLAALLLLVMPCNAALLCCAFNASFLLLDYKLYLKAVGEFVFISAVLLVGLPLQLLHALRLAVNFGYPRKRLVKETFEYCLNINRTIGKYCGEPRDEQQEDVKAELGEVDSNSSDDIIAVNDDDDEDFE
ncbi:Zn-finger domain protein, putative [Trypanosoma equiperdum]|uniref:Zn-finger domain protein, putative n=2 Tax=Trypanozoon TaxID=39700 RepID=Q580M0_TRYB2|nr:Zn-finger domain protein, putative [Trypanosoma brucei brucei TREU927]AAX79327.1 Zn-finger domain protein, putative [Trypanosoma brucei]AAZ10455.1 Zn-finger domain protein, putative [Trypanosoma brucei brucei TREU927]SCU70054.1 Zn-finger domain protein, putative [Trypanosoma equiperdum]